MKQAPLALPVCPYCGQHFSYKEVMKSKGQEDVQCPKCKQNFKVTLETPFSILIAAVVIIVLLVNVCLYIFKPDINFLYMAGVMLVGTVSYTHLDVYKRQPNCNLYCKRNYTASL